MKWYKQSEVKDERVFEEIGWKYFLHYFDYVFNKTNKKPDDFNLYFNPNGDMPIFFSPDLDGKHRLLALVDKNNNTFHAIKPDILPENMREQLLKETI